MSQEKIQQLLADLHEEIRVGGANDAETRSMLEALDTDIHALLADESNKSENLLERAKQLETRFAANHPVAERFTQEVIEILVKMGL